MNASAAVLQVSGVGKAYPGVVALDDVSIDFRAGEILGLVGKNGAGKSTLIKVMAGAVHPDSGSLLLDGEVVEISSPADAARAHLSFVHQELTTVPALSAAENVVLGIGYPKRAGLIDWVAVRRVAREALEQLGSDVDVDGAMADLGPVQQRLVMIARAIAERARVLVLDEPSASLTAEEITQLHQILARLAAEGVSIVYVSHRLDEILGITDRVVVMREGRVVDDRRTSTLTHDDLVSAIAGSAATETTTATSEAPPGTAVVLSVRDLVVSGQSHPVSFDVHAGEILGIAGLVGSGRTELVRAVFGADAPTSGSILLDGTKVRIRRPADAVAAGIALLPEDRRNQGNILRFSVRHNVTLATLASHRWARWLPFPRSGSERRSADRWIDELGIATPGGDTLVGQLSGGNQQKVVLAKWLSLGDPRVFILDEPTQGIDIGGIAEAFGIIKRLAESGKAVVLISSDFAELVRLCDRVVGLREGQLVSEHVGESITEDALLRACYAVGSSHVRTVCRDAAGRD